MCCRSRRRPSEGFCKTARKDTNTFLGAQEIQGKYRVRKHNLRTFGVRRRRIALVVFVCSLGFAGVLSGGRSRLCRGGKLLNFNSRKRRFNLTLCAENGAKSIKRNGGRENGRSRGLGNGPFCRFLSRFLRYRIAKSRFYAEFSLKSALRCAPTGHDRRGGSPISRGSKPNYRGEKNFFRRDRLNYRGDRFLRLRCVCSFRRRNLLEGKRKSSKIEGSEVAKIASSCLRGDSTDTHGGALRGAA